MNKELLNSRTLDEWKDTLECEGYSWIDNTEFNNKSDNPCYIAENAETLTDIQSYQDMIQEAKEWVETDAAKEEMKENNWHPTPEEIVQGFWDNDEKYVFFSTYLDGLTY